MLNSGVKVTNNIQESKLIVELLRQTTSLQIVKDFLKSKDLSFSSSSWEEILDKRILPAIAENRITNDELIALLQSVEECGHQHVFLYTCPKEKAIELMDRSRIVSILKSIKLEDLLTKPRVLDQPANPQIVDVRWQSESVDYNMTIKEVELRKFQTFLGTEQHDNKIHKIYGLQEERAVNVAKLHRDGLLEIRIASLANSTKYEADVRRFRNHLSAILPLNEFKELSLSTVKQRLWNERSSLRDLIRYSDTTIRDEAGNILKAATGADDADLNTSTIVGESLDHLLEKDESSYCAGANLWFKRNNQLTSDTHALLNGELNEFALPANCTEKDYNYVLTQLRLFNKRVS